MQLLEQFVGAQLMLQIVFVILTLNTDSALSKFGGNFIR
jgi:hypothetical protein